MIKHFHKKYIAHQKDIDAFIEAFNTSGKVLTKGKRNTIKLFELEGQAINVKSFKIPNIFNKIAYRFLRKSKAQRSFEYAEKLLSLGIGTPHPIAYYEFSSALFFGKSYYVSEQLDCDLTYRELIKDFNYPDYDTILRAFTRFTFNLHEKGVRFLDHSPGNTLIKRVGNDYEFYLVDLNRMTFGTMNFEARMKNFARLSKHKQMVATMSDEYAKLIGKPYDEVFNLMWKEVQAFRTTVKRKKRLKKRF